MLTDSGYDALTDHQMHAFDLVWADPVSSRFGTEGQDLKKFSQMLTQDQGFRAEKKEALM